MPSRKKTSQFARITSWRYRTTTWLSVSKTTEHMLIRRVGIVGAGTMGAGIAALAASAGVPVILLDVPASDGDPSAPAKKGLERQLKARPPAFMDPDRAALIQ